MKKGTRKGKEKERETRSEEPERVSIFGGIEACPKDLKSQLTIDPARQEGPATTKADSIPLTEEQTNFMSELANLGHSFSSIMKIMRIHYGIVDRLILEKVVKEAKLEIIMEESEEEEEEDGEKEEEEGGQYEDGKFEAYDPVKWATATEEQTVDKVPGEKNVPEPHLSHTDEAGPETSDVPTSPIHRDPKDFERENEQKSQPIPPSEPEFVRALKDSKIGTKPYFRKGHILRVINKTRRGTLDDTYFELLPLKPPGEVGRALIKHFEPADQAAAEKVGDVARSEKEMDSFWCAMNWKD